MSVVPLVVFTSAVKATDCYAIAAIMMIVASAIAWTTAPVLAMVPVKTKATINSIAPVATWTASVAFDLLRFFLETTNGGMILQHHQQQNDHNAVVCKLHVTVLGIQPQTK